MQRYTPLFVLMLSSAACAGSLPPAATAEHPASPQPASELPAPAGATQHGDTPPATQPPSGEPQAAGAVLQPTAATVTAPSASAANAPVGAATSSAAAPPTTGSATANAASATPASNVAVGTIHGTITSTPASAAKSAVVYLQDGPLAQPVNGSVVNKQMSFAPYISVVTTGAKITFTNSDPFPHNIFTPDHEKWDLGQLQQHASKSKVMSTPGAYTLLCNLHPNMKAYVLVVPSSYFAKSDGKGNFTIKDVPAGTYKVQAWAPGVQTATQTITVNGDTSLSLELHR